jgi:hypothetical protein
LGYFVTLVLDSGKVLLPQKERNKEIIISVVKTEQTGRSEGSSDQGPIL